MMNTIQFVNTFRQLYDDTAKSISSGYVYIWIYMDYKEEWCGLVVMMKVMNVSSFTVNSVVMILFAKLTFMLIF